VYESSHAPCERAGINAKIGFDYPYAGQFVQLLVRPDQVIFWLWSFGSALRRAEAEQRVTRPRNAKNILKCILFSLQLRARHV